MWRSARQAKDALRRDRIRAVAMAIEGHDAPTIAVTHERSWRSVQNWAYAYRDGGIGRPPKRTGRAPKLPREREAALRARLDAGPRPEDGVCALRGRDVQRLIEREFGVKLSLNIAYRTLRRLGYSCLAPRPRHEKNDPEAQAEFRKSAPLL